MATPSKSAGTSHSSGSEAQTGQIATLRGGFRASTPPITPQQLISLALDKAEHELIRLIEIRCNDQDWSDDDVDVDNAVEVALHRVRQVIQGPTLTPDEFEHAWYEISSVLNLASKAFSRPDSYYFRTLEAICNVFTVFGELVEDAAAVVQHA